jgi:hypothetical protein
MLVGAVILVGGLAGGGCATFHASTTRIGADKLGTFLFWQTLFSYILEGTVAAATVPLFLSLVGNDDIRNLFRTTSFSDPDAQISAFKLLGFCLIAGVFARRFLDTVSSRVFALEEEVKKVEDKIDTNALKIDDLADVVIESDKLSNAPIHTTVAQTLEQTAALPEMAWDLLSSCVSANIPARSVQGLAVSLNRSIDEVERMLGQLRDAGLMQKIETFRGERWVVTQSGRLRLSSRNDRPAE